MIYIFSLYIVITIILMIAAAISDNNIFMIISFGTAICTGAGSAYLKDSIDSNAKTAIQYVEYNEESKKLIPVELSHFILKKTERKDYLILKNNVNIYTLIKDDNEVEESKKYQDILNYFIKDEPLSIEELK